MFHREFHLRILFYRDWYLYICKSETILINTRIWYFKICFCHFFAYQSRHLRRFFKFKWLMCTSSSIIYHGENCFLSFRVFISDDRINSISFACANSSMYVYVKMKIVLTIEKTSLGVAVELAQDETEDREKKRTTKEEEAERDEMLINGLDCLAFLSISSFLLLFPAAISAAASFFYIFNNNLSSSLISFRFWLRLTFSIHLYVYLVQVMTYLYSCSAINNRNRWCSQSNYDPYVLANYVGVRSSSLSLALSFPSRSK